MMKKIKYYKLIYKKNYKFFIIKQRRVQKLATLTGVEGMPLGALLPTTAKQNHHQ